MKGCKDLVTNFTWRLLMYWTIWTHNISTSCSIVMVIYMTHVTWSNSWQHDNRFELCWLRKQFSFLFISFPHSGVFCVFFSWPVKHECFNISNYFSSVWKKVFMDLFYWNLFLHLPLSEHSGLLLCVCCARSFSPVRRVCCCPILLQPPTQVVTGFLKAVLMQDDVPHLKRALSQLLRSYHLDVHVLGLRFATWFYESLENFRRWNLQNRNGQISVTIWGMYLEID